MPGPRVLHVITSLGVGGAEVLLQQLLAAWDEPDAHRVLVIKAAPGRRVRLDGASEVTRLPGALRAAGLRLASRQRTDVVHTWLVHGALTGLLLPRTDAALLLSVHHQDLATERAATRVTGGAVALLHRRADLTVFTSHASRAVHRGRGWSSRSVVVPNGVPEPLADPGRVALLRRELALPPDSDVVLHLARLHPQKDHATAAGALVRALHERPSLVAVMAGRGVDDGGLMETFRAAGCANRVRLLGERDDVPDLLAVADVLLLSSRSGETSPLVVSEALAAGLPVVGTDVGDVRSMVGTAGEVVEARRPDDLGRALLRTLERLRAGPEVMREKARQRWLTELDIRLCAQRYQELYARLAFNAVPRAN